MLLPHLPVRPRTPEKCTNFLEAELTQVISTACFAGYPWKSHLPKKCTNFLEADLNIFKKVISMAQGANTHGSRIFPRSALIS